MTHPRDRTDEGERRKRAALDLLAARRAAIVRRGRRALLARLLAVGTATADDVRDAVPLPPGVRPVALGAVPGPLALAGVIRGVGYAATRRAEAHARPVTVWTLADRGAALDWLAANSDPPDGDSPRQQGLFDDLNA
jgi:hypothetical protein